LWLRTSDKNVRAAEAAPHLNRRLQMKVRTPGGLALALAFAMPLAHAHTAALAAQTTGQTMQAPAPAPLPMSPRGTVATQIGGKWVVEKEGAPARFREGKWVEITYDRPILRGRTDLFGTGADYGKALTAGSPVWRAGANRTTRLRTEAPLVFGDKTLPPGEYSVFVDLKPTEWTLIFSTQPFQEKYDRNDKVATWGSYNYDPKHDVFRVPMKLVKTPVSLDQFTIAFVDMTQQGGTLAFWWDRERAEVPFKLGQ
jgi:hypothetical protein